MFTLRRPYYTIRHIFVSLNDTDAVGLNLVRNKKLSGPRNHCRIDSAATPDAYAGEPSRDAAGQRFQGPRASQSELPPAVSTARPKMVVAVSPCASVVKASVSVTWFPSITAALPAA